MIVSQLNEAERVDFMQQFANVFEYHPEAADHVYNERPFSDRNHVLECFSDYMDRLPPEVKRQILVNHPMLGSKKTMTEESMAEQKSAGLNNVVGSEAELLQEYNHKYYDKFGFPYIICVLESSKAEILADIQTRYNNDLATETLRGVEEVKKIAKHRILSLID